MEATASCDPDDAQLPLLTAGSCLSAMLGYVKGRMRRISVTLGVCFALGLSACESSLAQTARARGATDLDCPAELVTAYRAQGGVYVARGCERWIGYACYSDRGAGAVCTPQAEPHPHPTPGS
jgi:hypothetical protein